MNVFVTGGNSGIGAASAIRFARLGWGVALSFHSNEKSADGVVADVRSLGQRAIAVSLDAGSEGDVERAFREVDDRLGALDALVNCAGVVAPRSRVEDMSVARFDEVFAVNVRGTFLCCREALRRMSRSSGGSGGAIVNVSSGAARLGAPGEFVDYAAAKAAVETFTIGLAKEVGRDDVRVNAVRPGIIDTPIHSRGGQPDKPQRLASTIPLGRAGEAEEVAAAITWLCGVDASYVNGAILDVTGGR